MAENRQPKFFYGYAVVLASFPILLIAYGATNTFGVFFEPLLTEFGWTRAATSGAFSLYVFLHGLLYIVTGRLNDRFGPRVVLTACGFFLGLGYLLMSLVGAIWQLYLFYGVIIAIGVSGAFVPLISTVTRWFVKRRGIMTGIMVSGVGAGTVIMPPLANWLISTYGWSTSYIVVGIIALVLIMVAAQFLRRDPSQVGQLPYGENEVKQESLNSEAKGFSFNQAIRTRQFWILGMALFSLGVPLHGIIVHIVPHATDLGISPASAANILAIFGGVSIVGKIVMGSAADRIGNKLTIILSFIIMSLALLWLLAAKEVWMLYLFGAALGFAYGGIVVAESPMVAELFGISSHGVTFGAIHFIGIIGSTIGPILAGVIFDITDSYQPAFIVYAAVSVAGLILASLLKPTTRGGKGNDWEGSAGVY